MSMRQIRPVRVGTLAAAAASVLVLSNSTALADAPMTTMTWFASADGQAPTVYNCLTHASSSANLGGGHWQYSGSLLGAMQPGGVDPYWGLDWTIDASGVTNSGTIAGGPGSFVTADLQITNFTATSQVFFGLVTVMLNSPILGGTFIDGSATAGVNGFGGSPASIFTPTSGPLAGDPVYTALIDGVEVHTLFDNPFLLPTPGGPVSTSTTYGPLPGPTDALNSISVLLKIEVSAFSTASVTGTLIVIPAPAGLPLLAGLALFGRRRRRA